MGDFDDFIVVNLCVFWFCILELSAILSGSVNVFDI